MAEKQKEMELGPFTPEERAYFDSKGEKDIPQPGQSAEPPQVGVEAPPKAPAEPQPAEPAPLVTPEAEAKRDKVDYGAFSEERAKRKEAEERARQMELMNAKMEERFRMLAEASRPQQQPQRPPPSADQDIFGAVKHMQGEQARIRQEIDNYRRQIQAENQMRTLRNWGSDAEASFAKDNPDYYEALKHLRAARARDLTVWGMSPAQAKTQAEQEEVLLLARAANEQRNPAQMAYDLARERGYQKAAPPPQQRGQYDDLNRIEAGQKQSGSLSNVGGGTGRNTGDIEIEDVLKMSDREFAAYIEKHPGHFRRLKGAAH
jgi:hypothetical protein